MTTSSSTLLSSSSVKDSYFTQALLSALRSRFVHFILLCVFAITLIIVKNNWYTLLLPLIFAIVFWKYLLFEGLVVDHVIEAQMGTFRWFSVVDDNLLLGAIPLKDDRHDEQLSKLGVKLILSVVEPFEIETETLMGRPVLPSEWKALGIDHIVLSSQDFLPPSHDVLDRGAEILDRYLANGHRVYVHCKSGRGRSASVIAAYLFKYQKIDMTIAQVQLKSRRNVVFDKSSRQMKNLLQWAALRRPKGEPH